METQEVVGAGQAVGLRALSVFSSREPQIGSRMASSMEVTSAVERSGPEPQPENGHLPRPWPCPREDGTPSPKAAQPPRAQGIQLQGPSVLESKVRALKERMTAGRQGAGPSLTSHQRPALKKPKARRVKVGGTKPPSEGPSPPEAVVVHHTQNPNDRRLDCSITEEEPARNGDPRPPRSPAPGLKCRNRRSPWPPEAVWTRSEYDRALPPGPSSLQEVPIHKVTPGQPGGSHPCNKTIHVLTLRKGRSHPRQDGLGTQGDLDSLSPTSEEDFVPRPALLGELWKTRDLGALGTEGSTLSLSDRVERNRLLLQEMLSVGGQGPSKVGVPGWTSCWDRAVPGKVHCLGLGAGGSGGSLGEGKGDEGYLGGEGWESGRAQLFITRFLGCPLGLGFDTDSTSPHSQPHLLKAPPNPQNSSPRLLAPGAGCMEDSFSTDWWDGFRMIQG